MITGSMIKHLMPKRSSIVVINGCFDILHVGHLKLFETAATLASTVIVAIDSDERVKKSKGPSRPINSQYDRAKLLESIKYVSKVIVFNTDEELIQIYKQYKPISIKGDEYKDKHILGSEYCSKIIFIPKSNHSSTKCIQ
jgi:D-beta-D-heptose 7-phosphate kinase/D-beta-D-heptose 1-phosphate adenosyltransferase